MAFRCDLESLILAVLQHEALHGYEIAKRIKETGSDLLAVGEGQLYPALHRLEKDGFVAATWIPQAGKPNRKVYALTDKGRAELVEKRRAWDRFAQSVEQVFKTPKGLPEAS